MMGVVSSRMTPQSKVHKGSLSHLLGIKMRQLKLYDRFCSDVSFAALSSSLTNTLFLYFVTRLYGVVEELQQGHAAEPSGHLVTSCNLGDQNQREKSLTHSCVYTHTHLRTLSIPDANAHTHTHFSINVSDRRN